MFKLVKTMHLVIFSRTGVTYNDAIKLVIAVDKQPRDFYPKLPTIGTFVRRKRNNNISLSVQGGCSLKQVPSTYNC